jgi:hypothetical protein
MDNVEKKGIASDLFKKLQANNSGQKVDLLSIAKKLASKKKKKNK